MAASFDLRDRVVLITGASKGIGRALALDFLEAGASVAVCARGEEALESLTKEKSIAPERLLLISSDVTKEEAVKETVRKTAEHFGKIDVLINNVGGAIKFGDFWSLSAIDWQKAFELNVMSMVFFSRETIPYLRQSPFPRIINISSISGIEPGFYNPHYTTTKASTINLSKYLASFLAAEKILVNCICPGSIVSDSWQTSISQMATEKGTSYEEMERQSIALENSKIPLGRMGKGKDISSMALFLASKEADWITGSCFHLNGGKMRSMA